MILPYIEQQPLYNASNVLGYPGWAGPYAAPDAKHRPERRPCTTWTGPARPSARPG